MKPPPPKTFFLSLRFPMGPFSIMGYGYREPMRPGMVDRPVGTGDFLIMFFHTAARAGTFREAPLRAGGFLFIWKPGDRHCYGHPSKGYLHSWIHCRGPLAETLLKGGGLPSLSALPMPAAAFLGFLRDLHGELSEERADPVIAANLFENWARDAARRSGHPGVPAPAAFRAARERIDRHYAEPLSLPGLAGAARLSPSHFSSGFRRHFGVPPIDYLIRRRLHQAAYLLQDINLSVTEVARQVGYDDLFYFSKLFKRFHGASPRAYRGRALAGRSAISFR